MEKLRTVVVGLNMGRNHCRIFHASPYFSLEAVCDIDPVRVQWVQENVCPCPGYDDYEKMLAAVRPEVVVVATPSDLHCSMTLLAAQYGAKGIYCEKPMAVSMIEAHAMTGICNKLGIKLMIGHQRRLTPVYNTMTQLMDEGAIGEVYLIRGTCAGDILSDGTHTVDSVRYLLGDIKAKWVLASLYRQPVGSMQRNGQVLTGRRYGHSIESGASAVIEFEGGVRGEILTGGLWFPKRKYQDIEIFGTKGRIWRAGDSADPAILMQNDKTVGFEEVPVRHFVEDKEQLDGGGHGANMKERGLAIEGLAEMITTGCTHPMDGDNALRTHEIVMAIFESARLHSRLDFPLKQDRFPLDMMIESGELH